MIRQVLLVTTALAAATTVALAGAPKLPAHSPPGTIAMHDAHGNAMVFGAGAVHSGGKVTEPPSNTLPIFNLMSKMKLAPYLPWDAYITGCFSGGSFCYYQAQQFTPAASVTTKQVKLGLAAYITGGSYTYKADVSIYTDSAGLPGTALATKTVTAGNAFFGACCAINKVKMAVSLTGGVPYWVVVGPSAGTDSTVWLLQDADEVNATLKAYTYTGASGWYSYSTNWFRQGMEVL